jgi:hypothetical protein
LDHRTTREEIQVTTPSEHTVLVALGRLEGKMDSLISLQKQFEAKLDMHDKRLRDLENHKAYALGIAAAVGSGLSLAISYLMRR